MFNKATDAVSKMTIKMNESDIVSIWTPLGSPHPRSRAVCSPQLKLWVRDARKAPQQCRLWESALGLPISVVRGEAAGGGV